MLNIQLKKKEVTMKLLNIGNLNLFNRVYQIKKNINRKSHLKILNYSAFQKLLCIRTK